MAVERLDVPQNVGDEALAGFHDDEQRGVDLQTAMNGTAHQQGGRFDLEARGMTTEITGIEAQENLRQFNLEQQALAEGRQLANEPLYVQEGQVDYQGGGDAGHWRKLYGDSENAKGELRRQLQAQNDLIAQMQSQLASTIQPPQFFTQGPPQGAPFVPAAPQYPPSYPQAPYGTPSWNAGPGPGAVDNGLSFLANMDDEGVVYGKDIKGVLRDTVAPLVSGVYQMAQTAEQRAQAAQAALFNSEKARLGVTPQVERAMIVKYPWLGNINDPTAYLNTVAGLAANERVQQTPSPQGVGGNGNGVQPPLQRVLRRVAFVEGSNNLSRGEPGQRSQANTWETRWAETLRIPYGDPRRAAAQKALLAERQGPQVSGYRDPSILTR